MMEQFDTEFEIDVYRERKEEVKMKSWNCKDCCRKKKTNNIIVFVFCQECLKIMEEECDESRNKNKGN